MSDQFFLSASGAPAAAAGARVLWTGRCAVAEYAFEEPSSLPRWTLPEETEVVVTEDRVAYRDVVTGATGELRWLHPQHLRVQPGNRDTGRSATVTQIQLVCNGPGGSFPALVFAGGDLTTVGDADRLANVLRQAIARYRVENANELGISAPQARMLSRLVIGPEFSNYQGGEGQTVSLLGSAGVQSPTAPVAPRPGAVYGGAYPAPLPALAAEPEPVAARPSPARADLSRADLNRTEFSRAELSQTELSRTEFSPVEIGSNPPEVSRPGPDPVRERRSAHPADDAVLRGTDDLEARAADLAARVADLISAGTTLSRPDADANNLSAYLDVPADPSAERAEQARRTAARLSGNAARSRGGSPRRPADDLGRSNY